MSRYLALVVALAACHHDKAVKTTPVQPAPTAAAAPQQPAAQPAQVPVSTNLSASADLVAACHLQFQTEQDAAPKFGFDEADLTNQDRNVLQQVADCLTRGPAKGHKLGLVGRADPRGTEEYNMGLGDRRAHSVTTYLEHLGVTSSALDATTRGALDATGTDDASWKLDRRVDLQLD